MYYMYLQPVLLVHVCGVTFTVGLDFPVMVMWSHVHMFTVHVIACDDHVCGVTFIPGLDFPVMVMWPHVQLHVIACDDHMCGVTVILGLDFPTKVMWSQ